MTDIIFAEISKAFSALFIAFIAYFAWKTAQDSVGGRVEKVNEVLLKGFLWCIGIALVGCLMMGQPTCSSQDERGCIEYNDDGYAPTDNQRVARFTYLFTLIFVPVVVGVFSEKKKN